MARMNVAFAREAREAFLKMSPLGRSLLVETGEKVYLGHEQREGWSGKLPFYLFWCHDCGHYAKDYPHGHIERQYLLCSQCGAHHDFRPWWAGILALWQDVTSSFRRK